MTRDNLIQAINDNRDVWSCPSHNCELPEAEGNSGACCLKCAERQLEEYEAKIRAKTIDEYFSKAEEALEKQTPKEPFQLLKHEDSFDWECPRCHMTYGCCTVNVNYCYECGQSIKWE